MLAFVVVVVRDCAKGEVGAVAAAEFVVAGRNEGEVRVTGAAGEGGVVVMEHDAAGNGLAGGYLPSFYQ